ncbi:protein BIG GRAIN 1-like A [Malania oleifera]|uniref:protein BIG GRAIN 1-like A n=1 Tax=Malania oleifera TaxID=397392 RepID=UPI0025ADD3BE|nr:protein BIG GRAIN 1-like A [Malania oleifera]
MDSWERSPREFAIPKSRKTPSFSSSLLDSIYRSIDDSAAGDKHPVPSGERRKQSLDGFFEAPEELKANSRRPVAAEKWVRNHRSGSGSSLSNSASSSSDSSCNGGVFSSSETESHVRNQKPKSSGISLHRPKPIRIERSEKPILSDQKSKSSMFTPQQKPKHEGRFTRTKSRALQMYGDLKRSKHPISPGGRIASFLNNLFSNNAKKAKPCSIDPSEEMGFRLKSKSAEPSTCSSVSSFSRSCLSKTPPPRSTKLSDGAKRCVRFYPVSVIVGEDCRPCGQKSLYDGDPSLTPTPTPAAGIAGNRDVKNRAQNRDLLRGYQTKKVGEFRFEDEDEDDDDGESCTSSDLFELDCLIGIGRYREELPVYETTNVKTNHAIANGLIL